MDKNYALSLPLANDFNAYIDAALKSNEISKDEWYELNNFYFTKLYLSTDNPRAQSGHGGDEYHYIFAHLPIIEAVYKNGTFCDVGCANGHLMEMLYKWGAAVGFDLQMYGVDISEGLLELAKKRLPQWHDRFFLGNAFYWKPEHKFDYIHNSADVPVNDKRKYYEHLMENYLADGGRMIVGPYWYENEDTAEKQIIDNVGMPPAGYAIKTHYSKPDMLRKVMWFDKIQG
ncbi:MAG: class I SAM-dependent methyltransferase [Oscillospiraceae bacterium]|nr:class I SAM-dependent methyltransferase [Oscillospiraceae bacterium]